MRPSSRDVTSIFAPGATGCSTGGSAGTAGGAAAPVTSAEAAAPAPLCCGAAVPSAATHSEPFHVARGRTHFSSTTASAPSSSMRTVHWHLRPSSVRIILHARKAAGSQTPSVPHASTGASASRPDTNSSGGGGALGRTSVRAAVTRSPVVPTSTTHAVLRTSSTTSSRMVPS